ncbi:MAG: 1-(5-phosphoribosyl)-5-[(5-phosphoribosylamino)methylideneamino]imidazole-4-carboxamide isomerase [Melioribacteraceae bacterium]|nr:1-(5-phosphoribosyl)-5-[(5-phosphoribosylamino)methylideneamino]imidazole-4-carboxamide isomerase [Melioribacteraceae bacterium]MCF8354296.1 1-(5-phosphoribosyl)-5-[(5-phosphoribosylamino)methylideneamino]imidazole-4-carboxamide isomerase [Melioribacteraceae bacterium]MCF8394572.1 1-(5-phosphoribosyl)-5-[(5-phosphoribosylamino)methylideneamino]imidazole-4-carboxamide isomerase [Melioribacteraceae bacterium]MCF8419759.1 1-(5-phosphoribosyl)-5-[(5-phosphoribosylamino)methylideneamino]imidazole-
MLIIPAIDIIDNKVVRLSEGDYDSKLFYKFSPLQQIEQFYDYGFRHIHIIDLIASKDDSISTLELLTEIKNTFNISIQFGGGIRDIKDIEQLVKIGVEKLIVGSLSITDKNLFEQCVQITGSDQLIVAVDSKDETVRIKGWKVDTGISIYNHIEYCQSLGLNNFLCTDISKDGMLGGTNTKLYKTIMQKFPDINLTASGGVSSINDLIELSNMNIHSVVVGKAIYENKISLEEIKNFAG